MRVIISVKELSPACLGVGHFAATTRPGLNAIVFNGRIRGRQLPAGTYRITVRTRSGRVLRRLVIVIVNGPTPPSDLASLRRANLCAADARGSSTTGTAALAAGASAGSDGPGAGAAAVAASQQQPSAAGIGPITGANVHSGVLGAVAEKTAKALQPLLVVLLAASILLLGVASLPREVVPAGPRVHDALARHRVELAALGAAALVAVAIAFLLN